MAKKGCNGAKGKRGMADEYGPGAGAAVMPRKRKGKVGFKPRGPRS
jgi:hypothetical protein